MSRPYKYYRQSDFRGGICMEPENAETNQVLDARNVWAPEGKIVSRPGYVGVTTRFALDITTSALGTFSLVDKLEVASSGAVDFNIDTMGSTTYWYFGMSTLPTNGVDKITIIPTAFTANTNSVGAVAEVWVGTEWRAVKIREDGSGDKHLGNSSSTSIGFVAPSDWTTTTVAGVSRYWLRLRPLGDTNNSDMTAPITAEVATNNIVYPHYLGLANFPTSKRFINSHRQDSTTNLFIYATDSLNGLGTDAGGQAATGVARATQPGTIAVVPEADIFYLAAAGAVYQMRRTGNPSLAEVNALPEIVGTIGGIKSPYHIDYVPQLAAYPKANLTTYFKGLVWFAGIQDEPFTIRWSAPAIDGAYNVLPEDSFEILAEDDNSPVTAIAGLNEHLVVFKADSIWLMVYSGLNDLELPTFTPVKVVSGVGCVAHGSVQQVRGKLIFLGADGVYAFDGTPNVQKLSETIEEQTAKIRTGARLRATSVHWQTQNAYLLSVAIDAETASTSTSAALEPNNFVFVYDYAHNAWWFWDNIEAQFWLRDEGVADEEIIYFADARARLYQLFGNHDNGAAINAYFTTHRFGQNDAITTTAREVRVRSTNVAGECDITLISTDEDGTAATMELQHSAEDVYGTAVYGTDTYGAERRVERKLARRAQGRWHQVKVAHDQKHKRFECTGVDLGYIVEGRR